MPELDKKQQERIQEVLKRAYSASSLHQMLNMVLPMRWLSLLSFAALIAALVVWSFIGRIPTEVMGKSIALNPRGVGVLFSKSTGTIREIGVKPGDKVKKGALIATIYNPQQHAIIDAIKTTQFKIKSLETELETLKKTLTTREELFKEGLVAKTVLDETKANVIDKGVAIEEAKDSIIKMYSELENISSLWKQEFQKKESLFAQTPENLDAIEKQLSNVEAPDDGTILEVLVRVGTIVSLKDPLIWMEYPQGEKNGLSFLAAFPLEEGSKIRIGMPVKIEPAMINPQEYGSMLGTVTEVSRYPASEADLMTTLGNRQLVDFLMGNSKAVIQATVTPQTDPETASGYAWTSKQGPPYKIPTGSNAEIKVVVEEQPPISYLIPLWKIKQPFQD